jgi:hypothetical protein
MIVALGQSDYYQRLISHCSDIGCKKIVVTLASRCSPVSSAAPEGVFDIFAVTKSDGRS